MVLRASSADGNVFFKCSAEAFRHEAVVTQKLAGLMPDLVPEVIAIDDSRGWMLMRDLGAAELLHQPFQGGGDPNTSGGRRSPGMLTFTVSFDHLPPMIYVQGAKLAGAICACVGCFFLYMH